MSGFDRSHSPDTGSDDDACPQSIEGILIQSGILHGQICSNQSKVSESVHPLCLLAIHPVFGVKLLDLSGHLGAKFRRIEQGDAGNAVSPSKQAIPESLSPDANGCDYANAGYDNTVLCHFLDSPALSCPKTNSEPN